MMENERSGAPPPQPPRLLGFLAEFDGPDALVAAAASMRDSEYTKWDAHTSFALHDLSRAMGLKPSPLQYITIFAAAIGALAGLGMEFWMNSMDYPYVLSGKTVYSIPQYIPIMFECTVLFGAFGVLGALLMLARLPKYYHAVFSNRAFQRASSDGFFISVEAEDPKFDADAVSAFLNSIGAANVVRLEE